MTFFWKSVVTCIFVMNDELATQEITKCTSQSVTFEDWLLGLFLSHTLLF